MLRIVLISVVSSACGVAALVDGPALNLQQGPTDVLENELARSESESARLPMVDRFFNVFLPLQFRIFMSAGLAGGIMLFAMSLAGLTCDQVAHNAGRLWFTSFLMCVFFYVFQPHMGITCPYV